MIVRLPLLKKLLIVDDDLGFAQELKNTLSEHDMHVQVVAKGDDCLQVLRNHQFDFILLDWNLPDRTGLEVCQKFRDSGGKTPIIFLTSRHGIDDKEAGLDAGGDDYITKPFLVRELLARMRTIERRVVNFEQDAFTIQDVLLKPNLRIARRGANEVRLSATETEILVFLMTNRDRIVPSLEIFNALWTADSDTDQSVVRSNVRMLRRRLEKIQADNLVETVAGGGYIIRSTPLPEPS